MSPRTAIGKEHAGNIQRPASDDIAASDGSERPAVESPQQAEHWLGPGVGDDDTRHARREQGREFDIACGKGTFDGIAGRTETARFANSGYYDLMATCLDTLGSLNCFLGLIGADSDKL